MKTKQLLFLVSASAALSVPAFADEVRCRDGSVFVGKVESVDGGIVTVSNASDDAGKTKIKQGEIVSISTAEPVYVRTPDDNTLLGKIVPAENGKMKIDGGSVSANLEVAQITGAWRRGELSPEEKKIKALERRWEYSVAGSLLGKTGNTESISGGVSADAVMKTPDDTLKFYVSYNYGKTKDSDKNEQGDYEWSKSADDLHCGVDYSADISPMTFWYAREDLGFDRIKNIRFLSTSAAGLGLKFIEEDDWHLSVRAGLSYRYETYKNYMNDDDDWDDPDDTSALGMDFGLHHDCAWSWGKIVTDISYTPAFEDFFGDYVATHESYVEFKVDGIDNMDIRIGMKNEYRSETTADRHLDTTYYAKVVFTWK